MSKVSLRSIAPLFNRGGSDSLDELALRRELSRSLNIVGFVLSACYLVLSFLHPWVIRPMETAWVIAGISFLSFLILLFSTAWLRRSESSESLNYWIGLIFVGVMVTNSGVHLWMTGQAMQSTNFLLIVLGVGCVLVSFSSWIISVSLVWIVWALAGPLAFADPNWGHLGFLLLMGTAISVTLLTIRLGHHRRMENSRRELEEKARSLERSNAVLLEAEQRLNEAQEIGQIGSWLYKAGEEEWWWSREVYRIFGLEAGEERPNWELCRDRVLPDDLDRVIDGTHGLLERGGNLTVEFEIDQPGGDRRWVQLRGKRADDEEGQRVSGTIQDVTARKQQEREREALETQLRRAQRMDALGTLAGGIAHDFNNILFSILGNAQLAELDVPEGHSARKSLENIVGASRRARDVVRQILTFSQRQEVAMEELQLSDVVREVLELLRASIPPSIEILTDLDPKCPAISGDQSQIHQILVNLCTNAVDAMQKDGGSLRISVKTVWPNARQLQRYPDLEEGVMVGLWVEDTGVGMSEESLEHIFEPFFTTKTDSGGTGLGLSVVHGIVKRHHGAISARSRSGHGTVFELFFPIVQAGVPREPVDRQDVPHGDGERVLLVDDDESVLRAVSQLLDRLGYRVTECLNPLDALHLLERYPARFDILITDLRMKEMTGTELAERATQVRPGLPVVLITGHAAELSSDELKRCGVSCLIHKPTTRENLARRIRDVMNSAPSQAKEDLELSR